MIENNVRRLADESVLCWLATSSSDGEPNVSPKEVFSIYGDDSIIIANIASPRSARNIRQNPRACVSFINIFTQKGYQLSGAASCLSKDDQEFALIEPELLRITEGRFPFKSAFRVLATEVREIIAPRYRLYPETTERDQVASAMLRYGVQARG